MKCIYSSIALSLGLGLFFTGSVQPLRASDVPEDLGYPRDGTRRGGGSRGDMCDLPSDSPPLTALMPDTATWTTSKTDSETSSETNHETHGTEQEIVLSWTTNPSPDIWFYLPHTLSETSRVEFTLKNVTGDRLKRVRLDTADHIPTTPSIISVPLLELDIVLTPDTDYHWYLTVGCEGGPPIVVDGWIRHQTTDTGNDAPNHHRRFFVDSLSTLANAQLANSDNSSAQTTWRELLDSVGLGDIEAAPIADCCHFIE